VRIEKIGLICLTIIIFNFKVNLDCRVNLILLVYFVNVEGIPDNKVLTTLFWRQGALCSTKSGFSTPKGI
jgi:hypothetical protein